MKKYIIAGLFAIIVLLIVGCMSGAQAATRTHGCVTKSEYTHLRGDASPSAVAKKFGTRGQVINQTIEHLQNSGDETDSTRTETTIIMTVRYDKCGHWGSRKYVRAAYAIWWTPDTQQFYTETFALDEMVMAWRRA